MIFLQFTINKSSIIWRPVLYQLSYTPKLTIHCFNLIFFGNMAILRNCQRWIKTYSKIKKYSKFYSKSFADNIIINLIKILSLPYLICYVFLKFNLLVLSEKAVRHVSEQNFLSDLPLVYCKHPTFIPKVE